jgi:hypothetical protein
VRTSTTELRSGQIFYGWWVVLVSAIGLFWGVPISVYSFTVFLKPLMKEFHAGRATISLAFTLQPALVHQEHLHHVANSNEGISNQ